MPVSFNKDFDFEEIKSLIFDKISEYTDLGIAIINCDGEFVYYNEVMGDIEGLVQDEMLGKHIFDIFPSYNENNSTIYRCLKTGKPVLDNLQTYINFKGKKISSVVTDIPIVIGEETVGVIEIIKDLNQIRRLTNLIANIRENEVEDKCSNAYYHFKDFLTVDRAMLDMIERAKRISEFQSNVLIYGETGTGKEIIAQGIHNHKNNKKAPFIAQNCAAIPDNLMEAIIFGTEAGAFTGAVKMRGLFEQANGGTLLLDELSSLSVTLQAKLLRVLQEGWIRPIGSSKDKKVDVQVIATLNECPQELIKSGRLREDLFYRLNTMSVEIAPLRDRKEDVLVLLKHFTNKYAEKFNLNVPDFTRDLIDFFVYYSWNGNVRELINMVEYALINKDSSNRITLDHLPHYLIEQYMLTERERAEKLDFSDMVDNHEKSIINEALIANDWNVSETARKLGMKRQTLHNKIKKIGLARP